MKLIKFKCQLSLQNLHEKQNILENYIKTVKMKPDNLQIAKSIIINQLCVEANEDLKNLPIYKHSLKYHLNKANELLERRLPEYDAAFEHAEEFMQYSQQRIELITMQLSKLRIDELIYISHFLELYNKNTEKAVKMLSKI